MKSNYKKLGSYIKEICIKNKNAEITHLLGVSISKRFMPSIANIIGTDLSTYKIVKKNQFAYGPVTSRNGDKISIALLEECDKAIVSQAYNVFEIIDHEELLPEYLMMWFRRPEFDRYARFMSHGSVREIFGWEELCDIELPVPSIEEQRAIVAEYNTVLKNIKNNEKIIETLEATANAIYKEWFVEFNFPDENGNPYKSSGGAMTYNSAIEKEIPEGWEDHNLSSYIEGIEGGDWGKDSKEGSYCKKIQCIRGTDIPLIKKNNFSNVPFRYILDKNLSLKSLEYGHLVVEISGGSPVQSTGRCVLISSLMPKNLVCSNFCKKLVLKDKEYAEYIYSHWEYLYSRDMMFKYENSTTGVKNFGIESFCALEYLVKPERSVLLQFREIYQTISKEIAQIGFMNCNLIELKSLLLSKMSSLGGVDE